MRAWLWLKRIVLTVILVVLALAIAATAGLYLVDTEALKNRIEARVEAAIGRSLQIDGPLEASLFPWLGFEVDGARLANAPGFGERPFVAVEHAELRVRVLPLLRREVALDTIRLEGLQVNAARDAEGRTNWADLLPADEPAQPPDSPEAPEQSDAPGEGAEREPLGVRIGGIEVRDARLSWRDAMAGRTIVLRDFGLTMNTLRPNRPTPLIAGGRLVVDDRPALDLHLSTRLSWDLAVPSATLGSFTVGVTGRGHYLPPSATLELKTDAHVDGAAQTASLERIVLRAFGRATANGAAEVRFGGDVPSFTGHLAVEPFDPTAIAEAGGWQLPARADPDTLRRVSMAVDFAGTPEAVRLEPIELSLDDTEVSGHARADLGDIPEVEFALAADAIDLDRYLSPPGADGDDGEGGEGGDDDAPAGDDPIANLPLDVLHGVAGQGRITVGRLQWRGLPMEDVRVDAGLADGVLRLTRADLRVAGGRIQASGELDARDPDRPAARVNTELAQVQAQPLLGAFADSAPITGQLNASAALTTAGASLEEWLGALQGDLSARFADGAIEGINIAQRLRMAAARLSGDELAQASEPRRTDFSSLQLSARVSEGVARSDDLDLRTPLLRVGGQGWVNLVERTLDYTARVLVTGTLEGQGGATMEQLGGAEIPLRFSGALDSPSIRLTLADALEERARQQLEQEAGEAEQRAREEIEQEMEETGDRIEQELRERLEGVFE